MIKFKEKRFGFSRGIAGAIDHLHHIEVICTE